MLSPEHRVWLPLVRRIVLWALAMAVLWGIFPLVFGGGLGFKLWWDWAHGYPLDILKRDDMDEEIAALLLGTAATLTILWSLGGLAAGALSAYFAPINQPHNPWRSTFFRYVGKHTFWRWIGTTVIAFPFDSILTVYLNSTIGDRASPVIPIAVFGYTIFMLLVINIWFSINQALKHDTGARFEDDWLPLLKSKIRSFVRGGE
jgi:hypothetical protein